MKWGRLRTGERLHAIVEGEVLCGCPGEVVEVVDEHHRERLLETFPACGNCLAEWQRRGRESKPKTKQKWLNPRTTYRPRNKAKWE